MDRSGARGRQACAAAPLPAGHLPGGRLAPPGSWGSTDSETERLDAGGGAEARGQRASIRRLCVRISNCSRESLSMREERITQDFSIGVGSGVGGPHGCTQERERTPPRPLTPLPRAGEGSSPSATGVRVGGINGKARHLYGTGPPRTLEAGNLREVWSAATAPSDFNLINARPPGISPPPVSSTLARLAGEGRRSRRGEGSRERGRL